MAYLEIDMDDGCLWEDPDLSRPYRDETREYVQICLGLTSEVDCSRTRSTHPTIHAFKEIGTAIRDAYNYGPRDPALFDRRPC